MRPRLAWKTPLCTAEMALSKGKEEADGEGGEKHCGSRSFITRAASDPEMAHFDYRRQQPPGLVLLSLICL